MEDGKYHSYDDLIEDMELISERLNVVVGKMYKLQKNGLNIIDPDHFTKFAKECSRIGTLIHFDIQNAKKLKK